MDTSSFTRTPPRSPPPTSAAVRTATPATGTVPDGASASVDPSLEASRRRRSAWPTARTPPVRPSSPPADQTRPRRDAAMRGDDRDRNRQIGRRLVHPHTSGHVDEDVAGTQGDSGMATRAPPRSSPAGCGRARSRPAAASPGRWARPAPAVRAGSAGCPRSRAAAPSRDRRAVVGERGRRIRDRLQAAVGHLEDADLVRRSEPVLRRPQHAQER